MALTNKTGIPIELAVWLATDDYDYDNDPNTISATALLASPRKRILSNRFIEANKHPTDISSLVESCIGRAIHNSVESAWKNNYRKSLRHLGISQDKINSIIINPSKEQLRERNRGLKANALPIYIEQRNHKEIAGWRVSGKFDMCVGGKIKDIKSTKTYTYVKGTSKQEHILQGSIYRWLNPDIVTEDTMEILYVFKNFEKFKIGKENYPESQLLAVNYKLLSLEETEKKITELLEVLRKYEKSPEEDIPLCNNHDLWADGDITYKYYKNPDKTTRATRSSTDYSLVHRKYIDDGSVGVIKEVVPEAKACHYCDGYDLCTQKDRLIKEGRLKAKEE